MPQFKDVFSPFGTTDFIVHFVALISKLICPNIILIAQKKEFDTLIKTQKKTEVILMDSFEEKKLFGENGRTKIRHFLPIFIYIFSSSNLATFF